jgi:exopolysaccharide biosynthesis polyprenyl glycosylphosphotransferase
MRIYGVALTIIIFLYIAVFYMFETYSKLFKRGLLEEMIAVIKTDLILVVLLTVVTYIFQMGASYSRLFFVLFFFFNVLITFINRQYFRILLLTVYKKSNSCYKIMIMTTSDQMQNVLNSFMRQNDWEYQITYLTIIDKNMVGEMVEGIRIKADIETMFEQAKNEALDGVFIHIPDEFLENIDVEDIIIKYQNMGITVDLSINSFGMKLHEKVVREMSGYPVLTFSSKILNESQIILKRMLDLIGAIVGCIIVIFLVIFIAPAIRLESKGPIFFSQIRVGRNGRRFRIYKFRSMYVDAEERLTELMKYNEMNGHMFKMKNDPRITKVGKFLRNTSLDEFPQFFNVLKGDMSLVGTRPPTEKEFLQYEGRHKRRLALKSGVTGLWQVSGRSDISDFEDVVKLDLEYIDNWSLAMDIRIIIKTLKVIIFKQGSR